ncbi:unnamed protein product [Trichobilharzia regenti]|nr:unnamed protein product [Trichobilharzia regenti]
MFSHIGDMHVVHHLWAYRDLEARKKSRDEIWQDPSWGKCVMNTGKKVTYFMIHSINILL